MECRVSELRYKEIINVSDGSRYGWVGDVEVDLDSGQVRALVVPGRLRLFGLLGREEDYVIPWENIEVIGQDSILVSFCPPKPCRKRRRNCGKLGGVFSCGRDGQY